MMFGLPFGAIIAGAIVSKTVSLPLSPPLSLPLSLPLRLRLRLRPADVLLHLSTPYAVDAGAAVHCERAKWLLARSLRHHDSPGALRCATKHCDAPVTRSMLDLH